MGLPLGRELEVERLRRPDQVRGPRNDSLFVNHFVVLGVNAGEKG